MSMLDRLFKLSENNTTVATEVRAGTVTFLTMSYIIFVQPLILMGTGLSWHTVFIATCVSSAIATVLMAFFANYPIALAPAMGHNVLFLMYCRNGTINWQTGLGAIFISGSLFIILSLWGFREKIVNAIPASIKQAIAVGIGLLIAFLGFQWAGLTTGDPVVLVKLGNLHATPVLLAVGGLVLTSALIALRVRGAILIGIFATAIGGIPLGITSTEQIKSGVVSIPRPAPLKRLAVLPVYVPDGVKVDAGPVSAALYKAADELYETGRATGRKSDVISESQARGLLERSGAAISPEMAPARIAEIGGKTLGAGMVVLPQAVQGKGGPELKVVAYNCEGGKIWREYNPLPLPADAARLNRYAADVILGLPGHSGFFNLDILGAFKLGFIYVIFVFFFLDLFDTIGTMIGVAQQAGFMRDGKLPRAGGVLLADACGTVIGACLGTSTVTSYVESSAGVADGGRTGLANLVTAAFFLMALFFAPVIRMIGGDFHGLHPAVAPVLILIGSIMIRNVVHIAWTDPTEAIPAFLAMMVMPLTFSITDGIAFAFIAYSFLKLITGRGREVHWVLYLFSVLFIIRYACMGT